MTTDRQIDDCFSAPRAKRRPGQNRSVLFLLRRDLEKLYGAENRKHIRTHKAPMLAVLGMMAGIELLAKFNSGKATQTTNTDFKDFLVDYGNLTRARAEVLYQYRCALAHSYGLYTMKRVRGKRPRSFKFSLDDSPGCSCLIQKVAYNHYTISFWQMKQFFLRCVAYLEARLRNSDHRDHKILLKNFLTVVKRIGYIRIS